MNDVVSSVNYNNSIDFSNESSKLDSKLESNIGFTNNNNINKYEFIRISYDGNERRIGLEEDNIESKRERIERGERRERRERRERESEYINIYRYKFTQDFMDELHNFSKIHQYDDRVMFKEAWTLWSEQNEEIIKEEVERLLRNGYEGDILDKMFKSARYYFRKKSTQKPEPKIRKPYISLQKEILDLMDLYIKENECKPSEGFANFCNANIDGLKTEIGRLMENGFIDAKLIQEKFKKTYKNRYFILTNK